VRTFSYFSFGSGIKDFARETAGIDRGLEDSIVGRKEEKRGRLLQRGTNL